MLIAKITKTMNFASDPYNTKTNNCAYSVIVIGCLSLSGPSVRYVCHDHLTLEVMTFITGNQCTGLLLFTNFTPFAMHVTVSKVNNNVLLVQTVLY